MTADGAIVVRSTQQATKLKKEKAPAKQRLKWNGMRNITTGKQMKMRAQKDHAEMKTQIFQKRERYKRINRSENYENASQQQMNTRYMNQNRKLSQK